MIDTVKIESETCESNRIAAYLDGDLSVDAQAQFEEHLQACPDCRAELREHQLFLCELDAALAQKTEVMMPKDFSRRVAARATSDMSGVRSASENRKALGICLILSVVGFGLIGSTASLAALERSKRIISATAGVIALIFNTGYDALTSVVIISRVVGRKAFFETRSFGLLLFMLALAVVLLSRLISHYHRTSATE